jgi:hypothetical protein
MLEEGVPLKNMSQALNINDPCQLKQLMTKATWINFIIFHKMKLKGFMHNHTKHVVNE